MSAIVRASTWFDGMEPAFFDQHFMRTPSHRRAFYCGPLDEIVDVRSVEYIMAATPGSASSYVRASRVVAGGRRDEKKLDAQLNVGQIAQLHRAGYTVCIDEVNYRWPTIYAMCSGLQAALAARGQANVRGRATCGLFFAPPHSQGFSLHHDRKDVFVLQIAGRKTWQLYAPAEPYPIHNSIDNEYDALTKTEPLLEARLEPGDMLYVPRGFLHKPFTAGDHSLHLSFGVESITWFDVLREMMQSMPAFRRSVPSAYFTSPGAGLRDDVVEMLGTLADGDRLRRELARAKFADLLSETQLAADLIRDASQGDAVEPSTRFEKRYGARYTVVREKNELVIGYPGASVRVGDAYGSFIGRICACERFTTGEVLAELAPEEAAELLRMLLAAGFLRAVAEPVHAAEPAYASRA
jgi:hypothetical protein